MYNERPTKELPVVSAPTVSRTGAVKSFAQHRPMLFVFVVVVSVCVFLFTSSALWYSFTSPAPKPTVSTVQSGGGSSDAGQSSDSHPLREAGERTRKVKDSLTETLTSDRAKEFYRKSLKEAEQGARDFLDGYNGSQESGTSEPSGFSRSAFGAGWGTLNGCSVRDVVLQRDVSDAVTDGCKVLSGNLYDTYAGAVVPYVRGESKVDVDHIVPLKWAWEHGANTWSSAQRVKFANDTENLVAVSSHDNRAKGSKDPNEWLPSAGKCQYVQRFLKVADSYGLDTSNISQTACE